MLSRSFIHSTAMLAFFVATGVRCSGGDQPDAGFALKDHGFSTSADAEPTHDDAGGADAGEVDSGGAADAAHPDAGPIADDDHDGIPNQEDPAPGRANARLFADTFDSLAKGWIFSSVSMGIDPARSVLEVPLIEPYEREGWIGPQPAWGEYFIRSLVRVTSVGRSTERGSGRVGLMARVNQVTPSRYYACGLDMKEGKLILSEHEGTRQTVLASAPSNVALGAWSLINFTLQGTLLTCRVDAQEVSATSDLFFSGSVGFRSQDTTFVSDWIEVYDL